MKTFVERIKSGKVFLLKITNHTLRVIGIPDDEINGVRYIYIQHIQEGSSLCRDFKYGGVLINNTIYDGDYYLYLYKEEIGFENDKLQIYLTKIGSEGY